MKEHNIEKARAMDTAALTIQLKESAGQMFRLRFQMSMGQTEGLKKLRELRKERARIGTVLRERELGLKREAVAGEKKPAAKKSAKAKKSE